MLSWVLFWRKGLGVDLLLELILLDVDCRILNENIQKLSSSITPSHRDLRIPNMYHYECPWPAAQAEIYMINAYKVKHTSLAFLSCLSLTIMRILLNTSTVLGCEYCGLLC